MLGVSFNSQALGVGPQAVSAGEEVRHIALDTGKVHLLVINLPDQGQAFVAGVSQHCQSQQLLRRKVLKPPPCNQCLARARPFDHNVMGCCQHCWQPQDNLPSGLL